METNVQSKKTPTNPQMWVQKIFKMLTLTQRTRSIQTEVFDLGVQLIYLQKCLPADTKCHCFTEHCDNKSRFVSEQKKKLKNKIHAQP